MNMLLFIVVVQEHCCWWKESKGTDLGHSRTRTLQSHYQRVCML